MFPRFHIRINLRTQASVDFTLQLQNLPSFKVASSNACLKTGRFLQWKPLYCSLGGHIETLSELHWLFMVPLKKYPLYAVIMIM